MRAMPWARRLIRLPKAPDDKDRGRSGRVRQQQYHDHCVKLCNCCKVLQKPFLCTCCQPPAFLSHGPRKRCTAMAYCLRLTLAVCVYYCSTYYKTVLGPVNTGCRPVFPGSSRLGIKPKTPGWLVQDPTTRPLGDLIPTIRGSGVHPGRGWDP